MRVLIVDDHALVAEGTRHEVLRLRPRAEVRSAASLAQAEGVLAEWRPPDAVLLDLVLPGTNGMQGLTRMRTLLPQARIAVVSAVSRPGAMLEAFAAGAHAFLQKGLGLAEWRSGLEQFLDTGSFVPPEVARQQRREWPPEPLRQLSPREFEAVRLVASSGRPVKQLADVMSITENTFKTYYKSGYRKLGVRNRFEAMQRLMGLGALDPRDGA